MTLNTCCKVCGEPARVIFRIPRSKLTGHPIPDVPDDCIYYECTQCRFCFTHILDSADHTGVYDDAYWNNQDPDWYGRVTETLRLVLLANTLLAKDPAQAEILDFGCGMGTFVQTAREKLNMQAWGHDIIEPKFGKEFFLKELPEKKFDIIVSCEVLEHLPFPYEILKEVLKSLKPGGVFAFQTAYYDPEVCKRDWWYVGPANGHVSLYSVGAFDVLFQKLGGVKRLLWNNYAGLQAWQIQPAVDGRGLHGVGDLGLARPVCGESAGGIGATCGLPGTVSSPRGALPNAASAWVKGTYQRAKRRLVP